MSWTKPESVGRQRAYGFDCFTIYPRANGIYYENLFCFLVRFVTVCHLRNM